MAALQRDKDEEGREKGFREKICSFVVNGLGKVKEMP